MGLSFERKYFLCHYKPIFKRTKAGKLRNKYFKLQSTVRTSLWGHHKSFRWRGFCSLLGTQWRRSRPPLAPNRVLLPWLGHFPLCKILRANNLLSETRQGFLLNYGLHYTPAGLWKQWCTNPIMGQESKYRCYPEHWITYPSSVQKRKDCPFCPYELLLTNQLLQIE